MRTDRVPPHNADAERSVLGSVLIRPSLMDDVAAALTTDDFFLPQHREIYDAMGRLVARKAAVDVLALADELKVRGMLDRLEGGEGYLLGIVNSVPSAENVRHYVRLVKEKSTLRRLIAVCADISSAAYGDFGDLPAFVEEAHAKVTAVALGQESALSTAAEIMPVVMERIRQRVLAAADGNQEPSGIRLGISKLDRLLDGLQPGQLVIIAADTGAGKTALAGQAAIGTCVRGGTSFVVNLEMTKAELAERGLAHSTRSNSALVKRGQLSPVELARIESSARLALWRSLYVDDEAATLAEVIGKARQWRARHRDVPGLLVVDFLQLLSSPLARGESRAMEVGRYAKALKRLAKQLGVPIIAVSQLNRAGVRSGEEPTKHDLKESGDIEQAADIILLPYNPDGTEDGGVDIIVAKHRNGECRKVRARWIGRWYLFEDWDPFPDRAQPPDQRLPPEQDEQEEEWR